MESISLDRSSIVEQVADALRDQMFDGRLKPGTALREGALVESLNVSRSTVREALQLLIGEGLARREPNKGVLVRQLSEAEVEDIFRARRILELSGVRAVVNASRKDLATLSSRFEEYEAAVAEGGAVEISRTHMQFHVAIVGLLGSPRLTEVARSLLAELQLAISSVDRSSDDLPEMLQVHRKIAELIRKAKVEEAAQLLDQHLSNAKAFVPASP
ncbi:GntR family transcriptional regulator [Streptomyces sparsogenes]|uniref:GntR family transcriptional regulator n=1 Tax=Streptomyces sparsogenes DSM 40356 TaxID=1331668 RepID=A0A1R1SEZ5_9ACTN|nr:GntR family transcriptional regulator [Streptomyces sparsogenes]OMI36860.1 GntR family transcriptional regulator [Streptomyces sparsogenes DSM 40356]